MESKPPIFEGESEREIEISDTDEFRNLIRVHFGQWTPERRFCQKHLMSSLLVAVSNSPKAAMEYLERFDDFRSLDPERRGRALAEAIQMRGSGPVYFVSHLGFFEEGIPFELLKQCLFMALSLDEDACRYFLGNPEKFVELRCFKEAEQVAEAKLKSKDSLDLRLPHPRVIQGGVESSGVIRVNFGNADAERALCGKVGAAGLCEAVQKSMFAAQELMERIESYVTNDPDYLVEPVKAAIKNNLARALFFVENFPRFEAVLPESGAESTLFCAVSSHNRAARYLLAHASDFSHLPYIGEAKAIARHTLKALGIETED
jgi:hypothetical protein